MSWNYRVVRHDDGLLALHEVFYDDAGAPRGRTSQPCGFVSDADEGLAGLIQSLRRALDDAENRAILEDAVFVAKDDAET